MAALRNPAAEVLLGEMGLRIAQFHKAEAARLLAESKIDRPATFYWKGRGAPRKVASIQAIPDRPLSMPPASIAFIDAAKGTIAADVAVTVAKMFSRKAPMATGRYAGSLIFQLNGRIRRLTEIVRIAADNPLSDKERISIYPAVEYASSLESVYARRAERGIMSDIARALRAAYGTRASIMFSYTSGRDLGLPFDYAVPMLIIGGPGAFASTIRNPGRNARRRSRKARRK